MNYFLYDAEFDVIHELILLVNTNSIIGDILFVFNARNYYLPEFENILNKITEKNKAFEKVEMKWRARFTPY